MKRSFICIICPNGCELDVEYEKQHIISISGSHCPKGKAYIAQELFDPHRNIASSVCVKGGNLPLVSVRLTKPIPKSKIFDVINEINKHSYMAPLHINDVLIKDILDLDSDIIVTKNIVVKE